MSGGGQDPTVSVCVPAYNEEEYLPVTIESVLDQTFEDFELVVADDGSTDGTRDVVESYAEDDDRVEYVYQENAGVATAQNTAIEHASGQFVAILEADDLWEPQKLERHVEVMTETGADMTHSDAYVVDGDGNVTGTHFEDGPPPRQDDRETFLRELFYRNFVCTPTVVIRNSVIGDRPFDESYDQSHDHDLWVRIAAEHDVRYIDEPLARKRFHGGNLSGNYENATEMREKFVETTVERYPQLRPVAREKRASIYLTLGIHRILDGRRGDGRKALRKSLSYEKTNIETYGAYVLSYLSPSLLKRLSKQ